MDEHLVDLRDVVALDTDAAGSVYSLVRNDDGEFRIAIVDGRQEVLDAQQRQGSTQGAVRITRVAATQIVQTQPAIDFDVRSLQVTPSGRYLALCGVSHQDSTVVAVAVVDLHGGQPLSSAAAARASAAATPMGTGGAAATGGGALGGGAIGTRHKQCRLHPVDPVLYGSRPGLVLLQACWHLHSEEHLVLLTSDNRLRLYRVTHSLAVAEQTLHVLPAAAAGPQRYGLGLGLGASPMPPSPLGLPQTPAAGAPAIDMVAFAFGPAVGWGLFSVLLLASDGHVYCLGPVAPFGMRVAASELERLAAGAAPGPGAGGDAGTGPGPGLAEEWLEAAFGAEAMARPDARSRWPVLPHVLEGACPGLLGPLNPRAADLPASPAKAVSLTVSHALTAPRVSPSAVTGGDDPAAASAPPVTVGTAAVAFSDGRVLCYAMAGCWWPGWCEAQPQYMSASGTAGAAPAAVRCTCAMRTGAGAGAGGADAGAVHGAPRMVLLDVVELPTSASAAGAARGAMGAADHSEDDDYDEDDEDEYGYAAAAPLGRGSRRGLVLHMQAGGAAAAAGGGGGVTLWACARAAGCWAVSLPWAAQLPRWLGGSAGLPAELPPPGVTCVHDVGAAAAGSVTPAGAATAAGGAAVAGSCLLANPLLGGGLLLLSAAGALHFYPPPGAAALLLGQRQRAQAAAAASPSPSPSPAPAPPTGQPAAAAAGPLTATPGRDADEAADGRRGAVEAHISAVYGPLMVPPPDRALPKPPPGSPSPLPAASPEGLRHLTACAAVLRERHIRFCHGAAHDLAGRVAALRREAASHAAAAAELEEAAAAVEARGAGLEARVAALAQLHANLVERAGMLASLHWSLPRPLSHAEAALGPELGNLEARARALRAGWEGLAGRAGKLVAEARVGQGQGALLAAGVRPGAGMQVPEAQLEKVRSAVLSHYRCLAAVRSTLAALEGAAAAAAADRTAEALERGMGLGAGGDMGNGAGRLGLGLGASVA